MQISRVSRNKHAAKVTYDRLSPIYDGLAGSSETQFMHQGLEMLGMNTGETVLEIGCGTGKAQVELQCCFHLLHPGALRHTRNPAGTAGMLACIGTQRTHGGGLHVENRKAGENGTTIRMVSPGAPGLCGLPTTRCQTDDPGSRIFIKQSSSQE